MTNFPFRAELEEKDALLETEIIQGLDSKQVLTYKVFF